MNLALWICASLLAAVLLLAGLGKLIVRKEKMVTLPNAGWTGHVSVGVYKTLGALEVAGAAGLVLPAVTGIAPVLVPIAAVCTALLMVGAAITHSRLHEPKAVLANLVYLGLAVFVAWGRFGPEAFLS
ncbi:DoxX family protein [Nocardia halotolerans]|uniref:DoxX family protein n=1 Tax=Nocardia halotolerans TaxID=1755878 RepID=A0ABV8VR68_9NOCA